MPKTVSTYLFLTLLALASWWLAELIEPQPESTPAPMGSNIDYYSTKLVRVLMNPDGTPKQRLVAETLTHYLEEDRTELIRPVLTLYSKTTPPWIIHADTGTISSGGETIFLGGNVRITRARAEDTRPVLAVTKNLTVKPDQEYAETSEYVDVKSPPDHVTGTGMRVYFGANLNISILANVRGIHATR
jgi:lipopolysaccharide export system protein LptC